MSRNLPQPFDDIVYLCAVRRARKQSLRKVVVPERFRAQLSMPPPHLLQHIEQTMQGYAFVGVQVVFSGAAEHVMSGCDPQ